MDAHGQSKRIGFQTFQTLQTFPLPRAATLLSGLSSMPASSAKRDEDQANLTGVICVVERKAADLMGKREALTGTPFA